MGRASPLLTRAETLVREISDPSTRYTDFLVQFREVDLTDGKIAPTGRLSRVYGWRWDRDAVNSDGSVGAWVAGDIAGARIHILDANPSQFAVLCDDDHAHILVVGSRGSSKSELGARWLVKRIALSPKKALSLLVVKRKKARRFVEKKLLPLLPNEWLADGGGNKGKKGYRKSQDEIVLSFKHGCMIDCLSAQVVDDARADDQVGALVDETQLCPSEARENLILSGRRSVGTDNHIPLQTLETATLLAGEFEDYVAKVRDDPTYSLVELSVTDNIHLETTYDEVTGVNLPAAVIWSRIHSTKERFEQEVGVWDPVALRFHPKPCRPTSQVYWSFERCVHVRPYSAEAAKSIIRGLYPAPPKVDKEGTKQPYVKPVEVGSDITSEVMFKRFGSAVPYAIGMSFSQPELAAVVLRIFSTPPGAPHLLWVIDEVGRPEEASATTLAQELCRRGYAPGGVIPDAAGRFSDGGRTAIQMVRAEGFTTRGPNRNQPEVELVDKINAKLKNAAGHVTLLIDPRCKKLIGGLAGQRRSESSGKPETMTGHEECYIYALQYVIGYLAPIRELAYRDLDDDDDYLAA